MENNFVATIPIPYRKSFFGNMIVARGMNNCLVLYNRENWEKVVRRSTILCSNENTSEGLKQIIRLIVDKAEELKMTSDGKMVIPFYLREYAGIKKDVVFIKYGDRLDVWAKENLEEIKKKSKTKPLREVMGDRLSLRL